jgi:anti-sigma-K factor RskA
LNPQELISSGLLESFVLGQTSADETALVQRLSKQHPEVLREIESIEQSLIKFSEGIAPPPSPGLKEKIGSRLEFRKSGEAKVIRTHESSQNKLRLYRFGIAASLLLFTTSLFYNIMLQTQVRSMNNELAALSRSRSVLADEMKIQQASMKKMDNELKVLADPMVKTIALNGMNSLNKMSAMVHWNTKTMEVYFNASDLPNSPPEKQYQLWAIVDGKPVDAGMIDMAAPTSVFQKMKSIEGAQAFAVTIEKMGGSPVPTMDAMCFLGKV